ncbi:MAG: cation:proton antiporter [Anaplasmataceae bacterium]|nr:cation:proton antiporter [Anaplasmataceae bacterium]
MWELIKLNAGGLDDVVILLFASVITVLITNKLKISPVLGYFISGAIIGGHGLGLIHSLSLVHSFAEFGVVLLLFLIGLELTLDRLIAMKTHVFGFGTLQVLITTALITCIFYYLDSKDFLTMSTKSAIILGGGFAMSSTAIVSQVIQENMKKSSQVARICFAVLILQDFIVVPLLVLAPIFSSGEEINIMSHLGLVLIKAAISLIAIFIIGRLLFRPIFNAIVKTDSKELFMATTLLIVISASLITEKFELSAGLGAFVSGLIMAETKHRHEVEQVLLPFKQLLLGLFFMTVGMSINTVFLFSSIFDVIVFSLLLISLKFIVIFTIARLFRIKLSTAIHAGLLLSQGGEFAFILFSLESTQNLFAPEVIQKLMTIVTFTMAITPLLSKLGEYATDKINSRNYAKYNKDYIKKDIQNSLMDLSNYIVIAGFGKKGEMIAKMLEIYNVTDYIILEIDKSVVEKGRANKWNIYHTDITNYDALSMFNLEIASCLILTLNNKITISKSISLFKKHFKNIALVSVNSEKNNIAVEPIKSAGFIKHKKVIPTYETALQLGSLALEEAGIDEKGISLLKNYIRSNDYCINGYEVQNDE